ncbi:DUF4430 domain-containing protein [Ornithinibacillus sp. L9]|uniref:DUF4430 domain-containing protein n=1 Tax=Ornithinibacillus caprae TaxID=2678566 RepID=A0A6N8FIT3_9BACI|nr:DUF4430 domain-containing protein [Ornithinibacillus caprae]MUK87238.1 DUF4430 domain-containing protein [Ornithinibacillus caprae]
MSKWYVKLFALLIIIGLVTGCGADGSDDDATTDSAKNEENNVSEVEESVVIVLSKDEGEEVIAEEEISINEGDILLDVMKEHFDVEEEGGFITSIEGIAPEENEQKAWMYFVDGEMSSVGANEYELTPGEEITFDFQAW